MAAYQQQTEPEQATKQSVPEISPPRPSGIKFEKLNKDDKKAQLRNVMSAFGAPPP